MLVVKPVEVAYQHGPLTQWRYENYSPRQGELVIDLTGEEAKVKEWSETNEEVT